MTAEEQKDREMAEKADMVLGNIQGSNGGLLSPQQSNTFMDIIMEQPTIINVARTVQMTGPTLKIPKLGLGTRILRPAVENYALSASDRSQPDFGLVELNTQEVMAELRIPYAMLEDNIEQGGLEAHLLRLLGQRAALDIEEAIILGDILSNDPYLAMQDGILKQITSREVDVSALGVTTAAFSAGIGAMPPKYKRNKAVLRWYTDTTSEEKYRLSLSTRYTQLGDNSIQGSDPARVQGVQVVPISYMPEGTAILTDPRNIVIGLQRNFRLESFRKIDTRQLQVVLTARWALGLETEDACVQLVGFQNED